MAERRGEADEQATRSLESKTAVWWKDILLIIGSCLVGTVVGAVASRYTVSCIANAIIEREGPGPSVGDLRIPVSFFLCRLCGGLLGPFVTYLVPHEHLRL